MKKMHTILIGFGKGKLKENKETKKLLQFKVDDIDLSDMGIDYTDTDIDIRLKDYLTMNGIKADYLEDNKTIYPVKDIPKGEYNKIAEIFSGYYSEREERIDYEFNYKVPFRLPLDIKEKVWAAKIEEIRNGILYNLRSAKAGDYVFVFDIHF